MMSSAAMPDSPTPRENDGRAGLARQARRVALVATCLLDALRPQAVEAACRLLQGAGVQVAVPPAQTCCGQPGWNGGDWAGAQAVAGTTLDTLAHAEVDAVIVPSGSCGGMILRHWPRLFAETPKYAVARDIAARTFELCEFLHLRDAEPLAGRWAFGAVAFHDSCSLQREIGETAAPRALLSRVPGLDVVIPADCEICCGFGGLFSVELPEVSVRLADDRIRAIRATGARVLTGADAGCLMHLAGRMATLGLKVATFHVAEILAGRVHDDTPGINGITPAEALATARKGGAA